MRTFHIGGAAQRGAEQSSVEAGSDATIRVNNRNVVMNSDGVPVVMGRNLEIMLLDEKGRDRARYRVPYGAKLLVDRSEEHTSELQSLMRISYAVFCLKKKKNKR